MNRILISALALAALATPAAAVQHKWQGDMFIIAVSDATVCGNNRINVGDFYRSVYRPRALGTNPNTQRDQLSFVSSRAALHVTPGTPSVDGATSAIIRYIFGSGGYEQLNSEVLSGATVTPAPVLTTTPTVVIQVTINRLFKINGCNVTLRGTLAKQP